MFTLGVALRVLLTSEQVISVFIPNLSFGLAYRLEYLTIWMAPTFFALFFYSLYPKEVPKWLVMIFVGTCALLSIFIFIVPTYIYSYTSTPYQIFMLFGVVVSLYSTILAIIRKREGALLLLVGILALFLSVINDVLYVQGIVKFMELSPVGLFIFTLCQSLVVSRVFTKTYNLNIKLTKELEYNNKNLEKIVNERTFEIHQQKEEIQSQADLLEQQNKRLEQLSIVASETENAVTIANAEGIIEWVNAGFQKLYGYNFEEFIDNRGANLLKASFNDAMLDAFMTCIESESSVVYTSEITTKKGETKWVRTTLTPIYNSEQNLHRLVTIDSDITDLKQAEEAIRQQNEEITSQSDQLQKQNEILEKKNITIINSISYAKLIQDAVLPTIEEIQSVLPDTFIIYYPRDIVSGDFYWYKKCQNKVFIAAIDCTGHGVPGAFMSMIGNTILNQVINEKHIEDPTEILEQLDAGVRYALSQEKEGDTQDDGMDVSLCVIDLEKKELNMSLANHVALYFDGNQLEYIQGDAFSIGGFFSKPKDKTFSSHKRKLNKDSILYMFTDGFQDQFGGENNEKLHLARLKQLIELHVSQSIKSQKESISTAFKDWKGNERQIDDVLLIGCKMTSICD
ncbi:MAG: hypothetical protein C0594_02330 [Marinilabiliales bacterium]|nr:MAG: hypothetical protein C0594_02330 [Marinilabiliales bacterium]